MVVLLVLLVLPYADGKKRHKRRKKHQYTEKNIREYFWKILLYMLACLTPVFLALCCTVVRDPLLPRLFVHYKKKIWHNMKTKMTHTSKSKPGSKPRGGGKKSL